MKSRVLQTPLKFKSDDEGNYDEFSFKLSQDEDLSLIENGLNQDEVDNCGYVRVNDRVNSSVRHKSPLMVQKL